LFANHNHQTSRTIAHARGGFNGFTTGRLVCAMYCASLSCGRAHANAAF
jgi:hypothetical protein